MSTKHPKLTPIVHPWIKNITSHESLLHSWIDQHGSTTNIHNLFSFGQNYYRFNRIFNKYGVRSSLIFAGKVKKRKYFVGG